MQSSPKKSLSLANESSVPEQCPNGKQERHSSSRSYKSFRSVGNDMKWVIFPTYKWIRYWDMMILFLLYIVSFTIPYQIGVSAGYHLATNVGWMVINVITDFIFVVDTLLYFWRAYREADGRLVYNLRRIRKRYLRTFFVSNMLGNVPTSLIFYFGWRSERSRNFNTDYLIIIKSFDLLKLFRLARLMYIFKTSEAIAEFKQSRSSQAKLELIKYTFFLIVMSHWYACTWSFLVFVQAGTFDSGLLTNKNWMAYWHKNNYVKDMINPVGWAQDRDRYVLSLFWAIQTITSIGYGNVIPFTPLEWWFGCVMMLLSGVLWAYIIGGLVGVAAAMGTQNEMHRNRTDQANEMMRHFAETDLTTNDEGGVANRKAFRRRIRKFIEYQKMFSHNLTSVSKIDESFPAIKTLSPELQRLSSFMLLRKYLETVPYLSSRFLSVKERSLVAMSCMIMEFDASERIYIGKGVNNIGRGIFVFIRGSAFAYRGDGNIFGKHRKKIFVITAGNTFGVDQVLLENDAKGTKGMLEFFTYSKLLFVPRSVVLGALKRNRKAWKACARWNYLRAALETSKVDMER